MKSVYRRSCGLDVHKDTIVVCVLPPVGVEGSGMRKTYGTFRKRSDPDTDLVEATQGNRDCHGIERGLLATGVECPRRSGVPVITGQSGPSKSDGRDARRIAEYLQDGRLDGSFVSGAEVRDLGMMLRHRVDLLAARNQVHNHIRDLFETASIKLSSVVSDRLGVTGRRIVEALIAGQDSPEILSWKVKGRLRKKAKLVEGYFRDFHRTMLESHYEQYQFLTQSVATFEERIAQAMEPYRAQVELLISIPGIDQIVAWHILAELRIDLTAFPDAEHCCSWAGMVPGENESAGKHKSNRCRKGNKTLRRVLTQAAWAASHCTEGLPPGLLSPDQSQTRLGQDHRGHGPQNPHHRLSGSKN